MSRSVLVILGFAAACQHIDDLADEVGSPAMPVATEETQRINLDAVPGVAPVRVTTLEDPRFPLPRERTVQPEDAPPPEPLPPMTDARRWYLGLGGPERQVVRQICREGRTDPCFGMLAARPGARQTRMDRLFAQLGATDFGPRSKASAFCREQDPSIICDTPLVVAFDGEPVTFEPGEPGPATFAFQPGVPVHTDWPTATTPWIAMDRDGDGAITSGAELFGDATELPGGTRATNGFEALAALDANGDGVIDRDDPAFAKLVLWADRDRDRRSSAAELRPLAEVVIAIPLAHELVPRCRRGNCEGERGALSWRDAAGRARAGAVIDVYLRRR